MPISNVTVGRCTLPKVKECIESEALLAALARNPCPASKRTGRRLFFAT
jgi:hypothetical protein